MKAIKHSLLVCSLFLGAVCPVLAQNGKSPLVLHLTRDKTSAAHKHRRRDGTPPPISQTIDNDFYDGVYLANVTLGTLGQYFRLQIVNDAAETWVNAVNSTVCQNYTQACQSSGIYAPSSSSTYRYVSGGFSVSYADGTYANGDWVTDNLEIGGTTVEGLQFGLAYTSTISRGILGLGYIGLETWADPNATQYPNLPVLMYNQKLIDCIAFSLWLDVGGTEHGRLVFGGLDTGKFLGPLETLHMTMDNLNYRYATVVLSRLGLSVDGKYVPIGDGPMPASPDVGATSIWFPNATAYQLYAELGASYDGTYALIDCSQYSNATTLDFLFGSITLSVPMSELVARYNDTICWLAISPSLDDSTFLGLAFLRRAYVVYDFSNNQLSIAPTNPGSATDNITVIGQNGVSGVGFVGTSPSNTTGSPNPTNSTTALTGSTTAHPHTGLTTGGKIGIGVGVPLGVIALFAVAAVFMLRRRHRDKTEVETVPPLPTKSEPYLGHRYSEPEASQKYASMSPSSLGSRHEYSPMQPDQHGFGSHQEDMRELEA